MFSYFNCPLFLVLNEKHLENGGVTQKYFQICEALGVPRIHRQIVTFPEAISIRKTEQLLEECEGYHAKLVCMV